MGETKKIAVSGSFDPLHIGHIDLLEAAAKLGDVYVLLKGDKRLTRKKGFCFMPAEERAILLKRLACVKDVLIVDTDSDCHQDDFSPGLYHLMPQIYCAGADKEAQGERPEVLEACRLLNIEIRYGVGGDKIRSSSEILNNFLTNEKK
jgi:D-beta-D-heptose 7-phosphate kinase/D-beta-D-heptose 1-phosphate adenosyltransferase